MQFEIARGHWGWLQSYQQGAFPKRNESPYRAIIEPYHEKQERPHGGLRRTRPLDSARSADRRVDVPFDDGPRGDTDPVLRIAGSAEPSGNGPGHAGQILRTRYFNRRGFGGTPGGARTGQTDDADEKQALSPFAFDAAGKRSGEETGSVEFAACSPVAQGPEQGR